MMKWKYFGLAIVINTVLMGSAFASQLDSNSSQISQSAQQLNTIFSQLEQPESSVTPPDRIYLEARYILLFPEDYAAFNKLFDPLSPMVNTPDLMMMKFSDLLSRYPQFIVPIALSICKDAPFDSDNEDAFAVLRHVVLAGALWHSSYFVAEYHQLSENEQKHLAAFMADYETVSTDKSYQTIIDLMNFLHESKIATQLEQARKAYKPH